LINVIHNRILSFSITLFDAEVFRGKGEQSSSNCAFWLYLCEQFICICCLLCRDITVKAIEISKVLLLSCLLQHVEVPVPTPKKSELLLKLEATSLNPVNWKIQKGILRPLLPRKFPHVPGNSLLLIVSININFCDTFLYLAREHILMHRSH
jgi:hypothetical protein